MKRHLTAAMTATVFALAAGSAAFAAPGLGERVYTPYVRNGVTEVEIRTGRLNGGPEAGDSATVVELERGLNDRVSLALLAEFEDEPGADVRVDAVAIESVVYLGQIPGAGIDVGVYLEYEQRLHAESGVAEAKLLLARQVGPFQGLVNLIARQPLTDRDGEGDMRFGYAAQATFEVRPHLTLGLQAFGDLGTNRDLGGAQAHYIGPMIGFELHPPGLPGELDFEAAFLLPAGTAREDADSQLRLMVEWEHRF